MESSQSYTYDLSQSPTLKSTLNIPPDPKLGTNFARNAKWCPDGSMILCQCENGTFQLFNAPFQDDVEVSGRSVVEEPTTIPPIREFPQPSPVLDFLWYPMATCLDPATFCFIASVRECPVKLLDAADGRLRASYKIVDHRERQIAPNSLAFNLTAQRIYCGFEDAIEVFDLSRPGEGTRIPTTPSKKSKDGLKGIISSISFSPSYTPEESFYAVGSFSPTTSNIAIFSDAQPEPLMFLDGGPRAGVTQLHFNPMKPHVLYSAYRGQASGMIYSWDIRSGDRPVDIFTAHEVKRGSEGTSRMNQKMHFDIDSSGQFLSKGDQLGNISVFNLDAPLDDHYTFETSRKPDIEFNAHNDAIGSVAFHPYKSILLSTSGSRHFLDKNYDSDHELANANSSSSDDEAITYTPSSKFLRESRSQYAVLDSSIKIWEF